MQNTEHYYFLGVTLIRGKPAVEVEERDSATRFVGASPPLAIKPGKPVGLGDIDDCAIQALPGNPIAAVVAFIAIGRAVFDVISGAFHDPPGLLSIPAGFTFEKKSGIRQFLLGELRALGEGRSTVAPSERQGTAMLSALTRSDGFIVLGEDREEVRPGEPVDFCRYRAICPRSVGWTDTGRQQPTRATRFYGMISRFNGAIKVQILGRP